MKRFENKVVLVTGGANGLGANLVGRLVAEGAKVAVADIEQQPLEQICARYADNTFGVLCDIRIKAQVDAMVDKVIEKYGRIDVLYNNAGIGRFFNILEYTEQDWRDVIDTNLTGSFLVAQAVAKEMIRLGTRGVIINTTSNTATRVTPRTGAYAPSKSALKQLTKLLALELGPYGIRVNDVAAGSAMTRITENTRNDKEKYARMIVKYSTGSFATQEEISSVMLFAASDDASYCTGESFLADSGYVTW